MADETQPLVISTATKREAFHLAQALEEIIYYPDRPIVAGLLALVGAFHGLVQESRSGNTMGCFKALLGALVRDEAGLALDDPALRGYVFPEHETVQ